MSTNDVLQKAKDILKDAKSVKKEAVKRPKPRPRRNGGLSSGRDMNIHSSKVTIGPAESQCKRCARNHDRSTEYQVQLYRQAIMHLIPGITCLAGAAHFSGEMMAAMFIFGGAFVFMALRAVGAAEGRVRS